MDTKHDTHDGNGTAPARLLADRGLRSSSPITGDRRRRRGVPSLQRLHRGRRLDGAATRARHRHPVRPHRSGRAQPAAAPQLPRRRRRQLLRRPHRRGRAVPLHRQRRRGLQRRRATRSRRVAPAARPTGSRCRPTSPRSLFDPLHGTSTPTGTLRLVDAGGRAVHHVVNVMGRVRSCSPPARAPAMRAC